MVANVDQPYILAFPDLQLIDFEAWLGNCLCEVLASVVARLALAPWKVHGGNSPCSFESEDVCDRSSAQSRTAARMPSFGLRRAAGSATSIAGVALALVAASCGGQASGTDQVAPTVTGGISSSKAGNVASGGSSGAPSPAPTGVMGRVTISPTCPGPQKVDEPCSAPFANVQVLLVNGEGATVGVATTSEQGTFEIEAPAGTYRVRVAAAGRFPICPVVPVTVSADRRDMVEIACDSGMR